MNHLEIALAGVTFLERLRPDEIGRIARRFTVHDLAKGERASFAASPERARLVVMVRGRACVEVETSSGWVRATMSPGDCHGEVALLSGRAHATRLEGMLDGAYATLDREGLEGILADVPVVALPLAEEMARELANENDMARQLLELHAEHLPPAELAAAIDERRRAVARRGARVSRLSPRAIFQRLVVARGSEPAFWMLLGFLVALGGARLVVGLILKYGLEKRLFALVQGVDPNPMHVHHFNYGLVLIGAAGIGALVPLGRRALRVLSFVYGVGAGLVFDEFGLIYNLNPEYAQASSLISAAIAASLLVQLAYFRAFWAALVRRADLHVAEWALSPRAASLGRAEVLAGLDAEILEELAAAARAEAFAPGERIVSELEAGADVYVITAGEAEVSVDLSEGGREVLGRLVVGGTFGEMSSLTGELRSASVTAVGAVEVLILADADFDRLRERRPEVALRLLRALATRLAAAEETTSALFASCELPDEGPASSMRVPPARRGSIARVWRELVVGRGRDLPFLTLVSFVLTLVLVRASVFTAFHFDLAPRQVLRTAYMTGFALLMLSACSSLLTFRPVVRRGIALAYGVGLALILNELGVTLAFDIFFKDIHTADPSVPFDVERLYRRAEPLRMIAIGLVVLIQATYLRGFYRRAVFVVATRVRKLFAR